MPDLQLILALSSPAVVGLSDSEALSAVTAPTYTFRDAADPKYRIDATQVGYILGAAKAAMIRAGLLAASASADPVVAATAGYVLDILRGSGFSPSNADAQTMAQQFVAMGILTADDAKLLLNNVTYLAGRSDVTLDEVVATRAQIVQQAAAAALRQKVFNIAASFVNETMVTNPAASWADFQATVAGEA